MFLKLGVEAGRHEHQGHDENWKQHRQNDRATGAKERAQFQSPDHLDYFPIHASRSLNITNKNIFQIVIPGGLAEFFQSP